MIERFVPIILVIFAILELASGYFPSALLDYVISAISGALIVLLFLQMHGLIKWMCAALVVMGTLMLAANGGGFGEFAQALRFYGGIATLFIVTPLLSLPIYQGKFEQAMKEVLMVYGRKATGYSFFSMLLNFLVGIFLNMGTHILVHSLTERSGEQWRIIQGKSLMRGFGATILVSPYFVAMGMIILYYHISWIEVVRTTGLIVLAMFLLHYIEMRWKFGKKDLLSEERPVAEHGSRQISRVSKIKLLQLGISMLVFTAVLFLIELNTAYSMVTLVCTASLFVPVIGFMLLKQTKELAPVLKQRYLSGRLPMVTKEVALIICAGFFSYAFQESGLTDRILSLLPVESHAGWLVLVAMVAFLYLFSVLGFHPIIVVSVILSISSSSRADFGFPHGVIPAVILSAWGLALVLSPVSGSALLLGSLLQTSSFAVSLLWNWKYVLIATLSTFAIAYVIF